MLADHCVLISTDPSHLKFSYDPKTAIMLSHSQYDKPLKDCLLELWHKITAKGWLDIESAWKLNYLLKTGGPHWFTTVLVEDLLSAIYQDDLNKQTELLRAVLHIDIEQTTVALLLHVVPKYLQYRSMRDHLTDPHGTALAKLVVGCLFTVLSTSKEASKVEGKNDFLIDFFYFPMSKQI